MTLCRKVSASKRYKEWTEPEEECMQWEGADPGGTHEGAKWGDTRRMGADNGKIIVTVNNITSVCR